ncbi:MAG: NAD(P)H-dependent oxidoreductase [Pseudomonadota bacterium]
MRALVIYCHPRRESFTAAVLARVLDALAASGAEHRVSDLYDRGFESALSEDELAHYDDLDRNRDGRDGDIEDLLWADTLIFVYPTWWYGLPARLKGWLDRTLVPGVAFRMPDEETKTIRPGLTNITRIGVFTTCGASRWLTFLIGAPGKRTLLRGVRMICAPRCRTTFAAHYLMDSSTPESRAAHLDRVSRRMTRFISAPARSEEVPA